MSLAALLLTGTLATAQSESRQALQKARGLVAAQKFSEAQPVVEHILKNEPDNLGAWYLLGRLNVGLGRYDAALPALAKAKDFPPVRASVIRETFLARAAKGDLDAAAAMRDDVFGRAAVDVSSLHLRSEFRKLSEDPRFADLFPTSFGDPFVEGEAVVHDWHGEGPGHEFGWEARSVGDVDGDGIQDAVSSAPGNQPGADASGIVYVYSGKSGKLLWSKRGKPGDQLGMGIEAAGDVDADGIPDVAAGAPGADRAYVYSGRTGRRLLDVKGKKDDSSSFGQNLSSAGDVDGDGHADLFVGAPGAAKGAGRVYVFSGKTGKRLASWEGDGPGHAFGSVVAGHGEGAGLLLVVGAPGAGEGQRGRVYVYRDLSGKASFVIESDSTGRALGGMFASVVGDVDADGVPDVYASDWANGAKGRSTGRIYVHSGRDGERLLEITGESAGDGFGIGPARAGDVDGDGHDDLVIGAWQHGSAAPSGGKVYVYSGKDGTLLQAFTGKIAGETLGFDADGMGDVDGDGRSDFLVTSAWSLVAGTRSGRTMVISGRTGREAKP